ncbi:acyltransferase family protein [Leucobacter luti]|uniref:acyltransferase family protein n=1 Tax=Leucobacter luti TaxID=340320 RepID=UPI003D0427AF
MTTTPGIPAPAAMKQRVATWDNARLALIVLVVIGHAISTIRTQSALGFGLYAYIYLFHMPAMIALSGMFSRPETSPKAIRSTVQLLITWGVWEAIWALIHFFVEGKTPGKSFMVSPAWTLWFLVSLVTMRILLPYLARLKHPLLVSIVLALASGLFPAVGSEFSASRTLTFLPFFVAGWLARERGWLAGDWFTRPTGGARAAGWGILAAVAALFVLWPNLKQYWRIDKWLTWRDDYLWLFEHATLGGWNPGGSGAGGWFGIAAAGIGVTALLLVAAGAMTLAILLVVPRGGGRLTVWGSRTLYVYLLHGVVIWVLRGTGVIDWLAGTGALGILLIVIMALGITALLSMKWVTVVFKPIIEPNVGWLLKRQD